MARPVSRAVTLALALNVAPASAVLAPVSLVQSHPSDRARLRHPPDAVALTFDGEVRLTMLVVTDAAARRVETDFAIALKPAPSHRVALPPLGRGAYTVDWRARTVDGWRLKGRLGFTVT